MPQRILLCLYITVCLSSCENLYHPYIRNRSNAVAVVDVFLLNKASLKKLPNQVKVADRIVDFKSGFRQSFYNHQNVIWKDTVHFALTIPPGTTADLSDMAGRFMNAHPHEQLLVTVTANNTTDTLMNGLLDFRYKKFAYQHVGVDVRVLYYDINP